MFIDEIEITFNAGKGGAGKVSFFPGKHSGPDGGNGGKGGDIYVKATNNVINLNHFLGKMEITGFNGQPGSNNNKFGEKGKDLIINLPIGSFIVDEENNKEYELTKEDQQLMLCIGGRGGRGNSEFKSPSRTAPTYAQKGEPGQKRHFKIIVRMIADFGLIGLPNAGKSSLLNALTSANVAVAAYPFTTLEPNLGAIKHKIIADIPGLIEGASTGKGLGIKFLKHIQKVKYLLHRVPADSENVLKDYKIIIKELKEYDPMLIEKKQIILVTKSDLVSDTKLNKKIKQLKKIQNVVLPVSIHNWESLQDLLKTLEV